MAGNLNTVFIDSIACLSNRLRILLKIQLKDSFSADWLIAAEQLDDLYQSIDELDM